MLPAKCPGIRPSYPNIRYATGQGCAHHAPPLQCALTTTVSLANAAWERLASCVPVLKGLGTCLGVMVVTALWLAAESIHGLGVVSLP